MDDMIIKILFGIFSFRMKSPKLFAVNWLQIYCTVLQGCTLAELFRTWFLTPGSCI